MATYHSLNVALGFITQGFEQGAAKAIATTRMLGRAIAGIETGASLQGLAKGGAAIWATMRAVDAIGHGAEEIREAIIRGSRFETEGFVRQLETAQRSTSQIAKDFHDYLVLGPMLVSPGRAIKNFITGDGLPRDAKADATAARALEERVRQQKEFAELLEKERKTKEHIQKFDEAKANLMYRFDAERRRNRLGPRGQEVFDLFFQQFGHAAEPDRGMMAKARQMDRADNTRRRLESRISRSLAVLAGEQRQGPLSQTHGGSNPALLLGSREEYIARVKAMQQADPEKRDDRRHKREVERAQRETNRWLRKLVEAQGDTIAIPGGV